MLLGLDVRAQIKEVFDKEFQEPVKLILFSQAIACESCETAEALLKELVDTVGEDKLSLEIYSPLVDKEEAEKKNVERVPTIIIEGDKDYGIRYIGLPAGLEFSTLVQGIIDVSRRVPKLSDRTLEFLSKVDIPIELMVFVTQSCGYCPAAATMAWKFAMANDNVTATVIDAGENQDLAQLYQVVGVPKIVINRGVAEFVGAQPEEAFLGYVSAVYDKLRKEKENG